MCTRDGRELLELEAAFARVETRAELADVSRHARARNEGREECSRPRLRRDADGELTAGRDR